MFHKIKKRLIYARIMRLLYRDYIKKDVSTP